MTGGEEKNGVASDTFLWITLNDLGIAGGELGIAGGKSLAIPPSMSNLLWITPQPRESQGDNREWPGESGEPRGDKPE